MTLRRHPDRIILRPIENNWWGVFFAWNKKTKVPTAYGQPFSCHPTKEAAKEAAKIITNYCISTKPAL